MRYIVVLLLFLTGCASIPAAKCAECLPAESRYITIDRFKKTTDSSRGKLYLLFAADWCKPCVSLFDRLEEAGIDHGVLFINIDETWAFILSKSLEIKGVPALVVIEREKVLLSRHGTNTILIYLLAHLEPK